MASKTPPKITLRNRAWVPLDHVSNRLLKSYRYSKLVRLQDEETREWYEDTVVIELPVWNRSHSHLGFPRGDLEKLLCHFDQPSVVDQRSMSPLGFPLSMLDHIYTDARWPNQQRLLDLWLRKGRGIIKSPAASGKSVLALAVICSLGLRTIVIFNRRDFRNQWLKELHKHTDLDDWENELGRPLAGLFDGDCIYPITFTTYQQLNSRIGLRAIKAYQNYFGLVIVDEVHNSAAPTMRNRIGFFNPLALCGVTATPERKDGLHGIYYDFMGPIIAESDTEQMNPIAYIHPTGTEVKVNRWKSEWAQFGHFLNQLCNNKARNHLICQWIRRDVDHGRTVLVVSDRVKHCYFLKDLLTNPREKYGIAPSRIAVVVGHTHNRDDVYQRTQNGEYDVLIASKLIEEGVNIPRLDTLHLATPLAAKPRVEQRVGRIRRPQKGKKRPIVRDYVDTGHGMIYGAAKARESVYNKIGAEVRHKGFQKGQQILHKSTGLPKYKND